MVWAWALLRNISTLNDFTGTFWGSFNFRFKLYSTIVVSNYTSLKILPTFTRTLTKVTGKELEIFRLEILYENKQRNSRAHFPVEFLKWEKFLRYISIIIIFFFAFCQDLWQNKRELGTHTQLKMTLEFQVDVTLFWWAMMMPSCVFV